MFDVVETAISAKPSRGLADPPPLADVEWVEVEELEEPT
jgi:hypothetical protein